jgi:hypothetical protein
LRLVERKLMPNHQARLSHEEAVWIQIELA